MVALNVLRLRSSSRLTSNVKRYEQRNLSTYDNRREIAMLDKNNVPKHIAIIMDGNGRWARQRNLPRSAGHRQGMKNVKEVIKAANKLGVRALTLFAFSTENWNRPKREVSMLLNSMEKFLNKEIGELHKNNMKFMTIGREEPVPLSLLRAIKSAAELTSNNSGMVVNLAFNYGSRTEIVDAVKGVTSAVINNQISLGQINEDSFASFLYTKNLPDPDLLIRTSGEERLSNFLLWQLSYAELYFTKKFWPEFDAGELENAISDFQRRQRRFGEVGKGAN